MTKKGSASRKESEKRRLARVAEEKRLGLQQGALVSVVAQQGGQQGQSNKQSGVSALERELSEMLHHMRMGDPEAALQVFVQCAHLLFQGGKVSGKGAASENCLSIKRYAGLLTDVALRADPASVLRFVDTVEAVVPFDCPAAACYMRSFARLSLQNHLEECQLNLSRAMKHPAHILEAGGSCVSMLRAGPGKGGVEVVLEGELPRGTAFQKGDYVLCTFPHHAQVVANSHEAEVIQVLPNRSGFIVKLITVPSEVIKRQLLGQTCRLDKVANKVTYRRIVDALRALCGSNDDLAGFRALLLAAFDPRNHQPALAKGPNFDVKLCLQEVTSLTPLLQQSSAWQGSNESQTKATHLALTRRVALIQGPPGTGKTHTAVKLIRLWNENRAGPVLATADSNIAVDNILAGCIAEGLSAIRVGRPEVTRPELEEHVLELRARKQVGPGSHPDEFWKAENAILRAAHVVCATCSGAASGVLERRTFPCVLVDEAAQATEPVTIIPVVRGGVRQLCLIGDHKQLPATIVSQEAAKQGLGVSLFERLVARGVEPSLLNVQYRMHPTIAAFPSQAFYDGELMTGISGTRRKPPGGFQWPGQVVPVAFVSVLGVETHEGPSHANADEVTQVVQIVQSLLAVGDVTEQDIGVITPYAAQVRHLRKKLGGSRPGIRAADAEIPHKFVEVSSVDGFQGREKEVIIVSTVRANLTGDLGFVRDVRRMNVTLTRAKRGLIVCGHPATLSADFMSWRPWLEWCGACGLAVGGTAADLDRAAAVLRIGDLSEAELVSHGPALFQHIVSAAKIKLEDSDEGRPWKLRRVDEHSRSPVLEP